MRHSTPNPIFFHGSPKTPAQPRNRPLFKAINIIITMAIGKTKNVLYDYIADRHEMQNSKRNSLPENDPKI
jgi:hypothetical protein